MIKVTNFQTVLDDAAEEVSLTLEHMLEMHDDPEADGSFQVDTEM